MCVKAGTMVSISRHNTYKKTPIVTYILVGVSLLTVFRKMLGFEVAVETVSSAIGFVLKHLTGIKLTKDQLPNPSTVQTIIDHFIAKAFISDKLRVV